MKDNMEMISINKIYQHPDNPRKDLGNLEELADSIRKNGIMQNMTVIPGHWDSGEWMKDGYTLLIGHRRCVAAKVAGLEEVPCKVVCGLDKRQQISIMLEENMQRNDLTICEQAQSFQMMLDLGETEKSIAEKTGFSRTTVRHRLELAKLDRNELAKKTDTYQLNITDLIMLEQIKDIETRDRILRESSNSNEIAWRVNSKLKEIERNKNADIIIAMLDKKGIEEAPTKYANERFSGKWDMIKDFSLENEPPKRLVINDDGRKMYYSRSISRIEIIAQREKKKTEQTEWEMKRKENDRKKKELAVLKKELDKERRRFVLEMIFTGKAKTDVPEIRLIKEIWFVLMKMEAMLYMNNAEFVFTQKRTYEAEEQERREARKKYSQLGIVEKMLCMMECAMEVSRDTWDYNLEYNENAGKNEKMGYSILGYYGWSFPKEEYRQLVYGTHELYRREDKNGND